MVNGKFSEQLSSLSNQAIPSRTQRKIQVLRERDQQRAIQDQENFDRLQRQAQELQNTEFSNIFTVEEYRQKYNSLSSDLQQFFLTPEEIESKVAQSRDPELQRRISEVTSRREDLRREIDQYTEEINQLNERRANLPSGKAGADERGQIDSRIDALVKARNIPAQEFDRLGSEENILLNSSTPEEAEQRSTIYQRQVQQESIRQQEEKRTLEQNRILAEAQKFGYGFIKVEESFKGKPQTRKIYTVTPDGEYKLVSETKAKSSLLPSLIPQARISEVVRLGNTEITFEGVQSLFKTTTGQLSTAYGNFNISEEKFIEQQEKARREEAQKILNDKQFSGVIDESAKEEGVFSKVWREIKTIYYASPFGITSPIEEEGDVRRSFAGKDTSFFFSLSPKSARELVARKERDEATAGRQIKAIEELNKIIEGTPEELKFDVQQEGLIRLRNLGVNYSVDESSGDLIFTSEELSPKKSYAGIRLGEAKGIEKVGVGAGVVVVKGIEFYLGGEALGLLFKGGSAGYQVLKGSLGSDLRLSEYVVQGSKVSASLEVIERIPLLRRLAGIESKKSFRLTQLGFESGEPVGYGSLFQKSSGLSTVAKVTQKTGGVLKTVGKATFYTGLGGLYVAGKVKEFVEYRDIYGKGTGTQLFIAETLGEVGAGGLLIGENIIKNKEIKKLNEKIALENYQREIKIKRIENIEKFGQFSSRARVQFVEAGSGKVVLNRGEREILQGILVKQGGVTKAEAEQLIKEGSIFEQRLLVDSPAGYETFTSSRTGVVSSLRGDQGFTEIGIDFTRRGNKVTNIVLKSTRGKGRYALTSVFERVRNSKSSRKVIKQDDLEFIQEFEGKDQFKLKDLIVSKIGKQKKIEIGDVKVSVSEIESRVAKSFSKSDKQRTTLRESFELGQADYSEKELKKLFKDASFLARTSPRPASILRVEGKGFQNVSQEIRPRIYNLTGKEMEKLLRSAGEDKEIAKLVEGFTAKRSGSVFVRDDLSPKNYKRVLGHELGHQYQFTENPKLKGVTYKEAEAYLQKKYRGRNPYERNDFKSEYFADLYSGKFGSAKLKVSRDDEYLFFQKGGSGRSRPFLKNIFKGIDFEKVEQALKRSRGPITPLSRTFQDVATGEGKSQSSIVSQISKKAINKVESINVSSAITSEFKFPKVRGQSQTFREIESLSTKSSFSIKQAINDIVDTKIKPKVKQRSQTELKNLQLLRSRTIQTEVLRSQQRQRQRQSQTSRIAFELNLRRNPPIPTFDFSPSRPTSPKISIPSFAKEDRKKQRIVNLKKILSYDELGLFPSFTAKALDIPSIEVGSVEEALKELKKIRTGFEIGSGVRIRA